MSELTQTLKKEFKDKVIAHIYIKEFLYENIATQIKVLREQRGWTQIELAEKAGMKQSRISLLENPNYDKWTISTLTKLAETFDVGLYLSYENFSTIIERIDSFSRESLERKSREDDLDDEIKKEHKYKEALSYTIFDEYSSSNAKTTPGISKAGTNRELINFKQAVGY